MEQLKDLHLLIHYADRKAQWIFSAVTLLVAAFSLTNPILEFDSMNTVRDLFALTTTILLLLSLVVVAYCVTMTLTPRFQKQTARSLYFFGDIQAMEREQFIHEYNALTHDDHNIALLNQIHANAGIATKKYRWARFATNWLMIALMLWGIVLVLRVVTF